MPFRRMPGTIAASARAAGLDAREEPRPHRAARLSSKLPALLAAAVALSACGTLTETTEQYVMVQTVLDHQQVAGIGCVLSNDVGRWFVTSPGRVQIRKSQKPLAVDCRQNDVWAIDEIGPKQNASRWGNILLTAGAGQYVDRQTGAGFDYPTTLTVLLKRQPPGQFATPPSPESLADSQPASSDPAAEVPATPAPAAAPAEPGGSVIY